MNRQHSSVGNLVFKLLISILLIYLGMAVLADLYEQYQQQINSGVNESVPIYQYILSGLSLLIVIFAIIGYRSYQKSKEERIDNFIAKWADKKD